MQGVRRTPDSPVLNYFSQKSKSSNASKKSTSDQDTDKSRFQKVLDLRIAVSAYIVENMKDDPHFGRTKFVKVLYLAEQVSKVNLETNYYREAAGPFDQRALLNEKVGIEPEAKRREIFGIETKKIKGNSEPTEMIRYRPKKNLEKASASLKSMIKSKKDISDIDNLISLLMPLTTEQTEIVSTLYGAWNDLLIRAKGKTVNDQLILKEFRDNWHERKKRFSEEKLSKALTWMRKNKLTPKGTGKLLQVK